MDQGDGTSKKVTCNEHAALMKGADGNRKPQECGFRICNQKYMFLSANEENGIKFCTLSRKGGGGATVAKTGQTLLVGVWGADVPMSDGKC